jgi:FKBP-type peptidyl-prolyl cis-trans isomerase
LLVTKKHQGGPMADKITTDSGLQYEVLVEGDGATPGPTDTVSAHYHGTFEDGRVFDSSVDRGEPIDLPVNGVIQGWQEALQMMKEGDKWRLTVPPQLGYGERGAGPIPGNATLVFEVELIKVR